MHNSIKTAEDDSQKKTNKKKTINFTGAAHRDHFDFLRLAWVGLAPVFASFPVLEVDPGLAVLFLCPLSVTASSSASFSALELRRLGPFALASAVPLVSPCSAAGVVSSPFFSLEALACCWAGSGSPGAEAPGASATGAIPVPIASCELVSTGFWEGGVAVGGGVEETGEGLITTGSVGPGTAGVAGADTDPTAVPRGEAEGV